MWEKRITSGWNGPLHVAVNAPSSSLILDVNVSRDCQQATAVVTAQEDPGLAAAVDNGIWAMRFLAPPRRSNNIRGGTFHGPVIQGGNFNNLHFSSDGSFTIGGQSFPPGGATLGCPVLRLTLPSRSVLHAAIEDGEATITGHQGDSLQELHFSSTSATLTSVCELTVLKANTMSGKVDLTGQTGPCEVTTMSGEINMAWAEGAVRARTMSGDIGIRCTQSIGVEAHSNSGTVTVVAMPGTRPLVDARSLTGRVHAPGRV